LLDSAQRLQNKKENPLKYTKTAAFTSKKNNKKLPVIAEEE
jgi:hypothetical protein